MSHAAWSASSVLEALMSGVWSPEAAWWLGVVYSNGSLSDRGYSVTVTSCDNGALLRWAHVGGHGAEILHPRKNGNTTDAVLYSQRVVDWCRGRGLADRGTLQWPEDLPLAVLVDFVRGLWDVGGSLLHKKGQGGRSDLLSLSYTSKSADFVNRLAVVLPVPLFVEDQRVNKGPYKGYTYRHARISGRAAESLFHWLYDSAPEHLCGERTRQVGGAFLEWATANTRACARCGVEVRGRVVCAGCKAVKWDTSEGVRALCACGKTVYAKGECYNCYARTRYKAKHG